MWDCGRQYKQPPPSLCSALTVPQHKPSFRSVSLTGACGETHTSCANVYGTDALVVCYPPSKRSLWAAFRTLFQTSGSRWQTKHICFLPFLEKGNKIFRNIPQRKNKQVSVKRAIWEQEESLEIKNMYNCAQGFILNGGKTTNSE